MKDGLPIVKWDENISNNQMTIVDRWEEWFQATKDEESIKAWNAAKSIYMADALVGNSLAVILLDRWATIVEFNRLDKIQKEKTSVGSTEV